MKPLSSTYSSTTSMSLPKKTTVHSLNLSKVSSYLSPNGELDNSTFTQAQNGQKFQFDIYIHKVELVVPSPVYVFVQIVKGQSTVNTKRKLRVDQNTKVAQFSDKISIVTQLQEMESQEPQSVGIGYQQKIIQLKLYAFYNAKEKAIGVAQLDLSQYANHKELRAKQEKLTFQKCFDKNACVTLEVKVKEQFDPIRESITEDTQDASSVVQDDYELMDSSRLSMMESARLNTYEDSTPFDEPSTERRSFTDTIKELTPKANIMSPNSTKIIDSKSRQNMIQSSAKTARNLNMSMSQAQLSKQLSGASSEQCKTPVVQEDFSAMIRQQQDDQQRMAKMEEKVRALEQDNSFLRKENQEQKQKIVTLQIKEERSREYELKCNQAESYRQKCDILQEQIQKFEDDHSQQEQEKLMIIEAYERKLQDLKSQISDQQQIIQKLKSQSSFTQQQYNSVNTFSTQADELSSPMKNEDFDNEDTVKEQFEKLQSKYRVKQEESQQLRMRSEVLEQQLMASKGQIAQLVNELYSIEKEQYM